MAELLRRGAAGQDVSRAPPNAKDVLLGGRVHRPHPGEAVPRRQQAHIGRHELVPQLLWQLEREHLDEVVAVDTDRVAEGVREHPVAQADVGERALLLAKGEPGGVHLPQLGLAAAVLSDLPLHHVVEGGQRMDALARPSG